MEKIFQEFKLDLEVMAKLCEKDEERLNLREAARILKKELAAKDYDYLRSTELYGGIPVTVIIGGTMDTNHKQDFLKLSRRLRLEYMPRSTYIQTNIG